MVLEYTLDMIITKCHRCGKQFKTYPYLLKDGWGKYCSKECRYASMRKSKEHQLTKAGIRSKRWREKHPGYWLAENRRKNARESARRIMGVLKDQIYERLGGAKCSRCGFFDKRALCIDHKNGGGVKELRTISGATYYRKVLADKTGKYQILCQNCNWIKRWENKEVRKQKKFLFSPIEYRSSLLF